MLQTLRRFLICCLLAAIVCFALLRFGPGKPTPSATAATGFNPSSAIAEVKSDVQQAADANAPGLTMHSANQVGDALSGH